MACRVPKTPKNGVMRCLDQNLDPNRSVPIGTKCNVWCNEGFKLEGNHQRVCNNSGIWEGKEPFCVGNCFSMHLDLLYKEIKVIYLLYSSGVMSKLA